MRKLIKSLAISMLAVVMLAVAVSATELGVMTYEDVITPQYEDGRTMSEELMAVKKNGKWGFVDESNKTIIPFTYDYASSFHEGYAVVGNLELVTFNEGTEYEYNYTYMVMGFIDHDNNFTKFSYTNYDGSTSNQIKLIGDEFVVYNGSMDDEVYFFHNGKITAFNEVIYDTTGEGQYYGAPISSYNEGYYLIDAMGQGDSIRICDGDGNVVKVLENPMDMTYAYGVALPVNQGLLPIWYFDNTTNGYYVMGVMDVATWQWTIKPQYNSYYYRGVDGIGQLFAENGLASVGKFNDQGVMKFGAIDKAGVTKISFNYDALSSFSEGMAAVKVGDLYGYLNNNGTMAIAPQYTQATAFNHGVAAVSDGSKGFLIDTDGNVIEGSDSIDLSSYFVTNDAGDLIVYNVDLDSVIIKKDGKVGFGKINYLPSLPDISEMSDWAYPEVSKAIEEELVPVALQNLYTRDITRDEFADLIITALCEIKDCNIYELVEDATGESLISNIQAYPFRDSTSYSVLAANALGIIQGDGKGNFLPYDKITREEAAALLTRSAKFLGADTTGSPETTVADKAQIASWFVEYISYLNETGIMTTTGNNEFSPLENYTREQSYITIYRLFAEIVGA